MRMFLLFLLFPLAAFAEINIERYELSGEYGLAYHTLKGEQKSNNTTGRLTSPQYPFWTGGISTRLGQNWGIKAFGGINLVRFDDPPGRSNISNDNLQLLHYGLEFFRKTGTNSRLGYFFMQQERPLYFTKSPTQYEVVKEQFGQMGLSWTLHQRRRIGILWALGVKGYTLFPVKGGDIVTEAGVGGEAFARIGFIGPLGTSYLLKGFYQAATAPNADVNFTHEILGYALTVNLTF